MKLNKHIFLSYFMDGNTPLYGGNKGIIVQEDRSIYNGDTANTKKISFPNHSGTHIDFPNHFFISGKTSEKYQADFWFFSNPYLIQIIAENDELINISDELFNTIPSNTDFLILKTGFGVYRNLERYWNNNPGISLDFAIKLKQKAPKLKIIGMDLISVTSFQNRAIGREVHKILLGGDNPILLVEDMNLQLINSSPKSLTCLPILINGLDGSPITIVAHY